jgi:hypothetical protein
MYYCSFAFLIIMTGPGMAQDGVVTPELGRVRGK